MPDQDDRNYNRRLLESVVFDLMNNRSPEMPQNQVDPSDYQESYDVRTGREEAIQAALNTLRWGPDGSNRRDYEAAAEVVQALSNPDAAFRKGLMDNAYKEAETRANYELGRQQLDTGASSMVMKGILSELERGSQDARSRDQLTEARKGDTEKMMFQKRENEKDREFKRTQEAKSRVFQLEQQKNKMMQDEKAAEKETALLHILSAGQQQNTPAPLQGIASPTFGSEATNNFLKEIDEIMSRQSNMK